MGPGAKTGQVATPPACDMYWMARRSGRPPECAAVRRTSPSRTSGRFAVIFGALLHVQRYSLWASACVQAELPAARVCVCADASGGRGMPCAAPGLTPFCLGDAPRLRLRSRRRSASTSGLCLIAAYYAAPSPCRVYSSAALCCNTLRREGVCTDCCAGTQALEFEWTPRPWWQTAGMPWRWTCGGNMRLPLHTVP